MVRSLLLCAALATPALAQKDDGNAAWTDGEEAIRHVEVGVSLFGFANGSFIDDEVDKTTTLSNGQTVPLPYPGFGGVGGGGGLTVSGLWRGIVGLETGIVFSLDQGSGQLDFGAGEIDYQVGQNAWHVPLLLKVAAPLATVRPFGFFGVEWVFPSDVAVQERSPDSPQAASLVDVEAGSYWGYAFGAGLEFLVPAGVDLRIPLTFRGFYNPNVGDKAEDRMSFAPADCDPAQGIGGQQSGAGGPCSNFVYSTEWQWQAAVSLGLAYYFL